MLLDSLLFRHSRQERHPMPPFDCQNCAGPRVRWTFRLADDIVHPQVEKQSGGNYVSSKHLSLTELATAKSKPRTVVNLLLLKLVSETSFLASGFEAKNLRFTELTR